MALQIGSGITFGGGITIQNEGAASGGGTTFSSPTDFADWIVGDSDGSGYLRFQGPFNPNTYMNGDLGTDFYNFTGTLANNQSFTVTFVDGSNVTHNATCTVDHVQVHASTQVDLYYNTVTGDLPFAYGGTSLSVTFAATGGGGGGGTTPFVTGTLTVASSNLGWATVYGYGDFGSGTIGSISSASSGMFYSLAFTDGNFMDNFAIQFIPGTYGSTVVTTADIDGKTNISITIDGITNTGTVTDGGMGRLTYYLSGAGTDVFSLASKAGQTLNFSMTMTS